MSEAQAELERKLTAVLSTRIDGFKDLISVERLSAGASQETYRISIESDSGQRNLAMRRAAGGVIPEPVAGRPGLAAEALMMQSAKAVGVPEPEVYHVLKPDEGVGEGFIMEWLDGETLGARILRSPALDTIRPKLAYQCGEIMARIHTIDVKATGLAQYLAPTTPAEFVEQTWERYRVFDTPQPMIDYAGRWLNENLPETYDMVLVHNDFRNGNFMATPDGINAVLDWEVAHIGDPMRDLGWICTNSWRFGRTDLPVEASVITRIYLPAMNRSQVRKSIPSTLNSGKCLDRFGGL